MRMSGVGTWKEERVPIPKAMFPPQLSCRSQCFDHPLSNVSSPNSNLHFFQKHRKEENADKYMNKNTINWSKENPLFQKKKKKKTKLTIVVIRKTVGAISKQLLKTISEP